MDDTGDTPPLSLQLLLAIEQARTTRSAVAKKAGLGKSYVGKLANGDIKQPGPENLRRIEDALGVPRGHFRVPVERGESTDDMLRSIQRRLEALEARAADLATSEDLVRATESLRRAIRGSRATQGNREGQPASTDVRR